MPNLPSAPFTQIQVAQVAVDAPVSSDLMTDICVNINALAANPAGKSIAYFTTPGPGTWTPTVTSVWVEMCGPGNGTSGAYYQIYVITGLTPGTPVNFNVGGVLGPGGDFTWFYNSTLYYAAYPGGSPNPAAYSAQCPCGPFGQSYGFGGSNGAIIVHY